MLALIVSFIWAGAASAGPAATEECGRALVSIPAALPPAIEDPRARAGEITTELVSLTRRTNGVAAATDAIHFLDEVTRPARDVVAGFLQTRTNYASIFDVNEAANLATSLHDELTEGLDAIKQERRQATQTVGWRGLFGMAPKTPVPDEIVRRVRHLHHAVRLAVDRLTASTNVVRTTIDRTAALLDYVDRTLDTLTIVLEEARAQIENGEVLRRIETLRNDLIAQTQILRNVHLGLEQRLQYDGLVQDRVRTLLTVNLPLEAVMGSTTLDLSPLDFAAAIPGVAPPDAAKTEAKPVDERRATPADLANVVRAARSAADPVAQDELLMKFTRVNIKRLSLADALNLATACRTGDGRNNLLLFFANTRYRDCTQNDLVRLSESTSRDDYRASIFSLIGKD